MGFLSDALATAGDLLDKPRQGVYGLLDAGYHGLGGDRGTSLRHGEDLFAAAGMDRDSLLTKALGFGADAALDPLTWAGGWAGGKLAGKAFQSLGPRYGADAAKLAALEVPEAMQARGGTSLLSEALASPHAEAIVHEIPGGSKALNAGAESMALHTPEGDVLKLSRFDPQSAINYPQADALNLPTRRVVHGNIEVGRYPLASQVGDQSLFDRHALGLQQELQGQGIDVIDALKPEDLGQVGGRTKLLDLGSIDTQDRSPFRPVYGRTPDKYLQPGRLAGGALGGAHQAAAPR